LAQEVDERDWLLNVNRLFGRHTQTMLLPKGYCNFCKVSKDLESPTQHFQESSSLDFVDDIAVGEQSQTQPHHMVDRGEETKRIEGNSCVALAIDFTKTVTLQARSRPPGG
jgi:hypothetical protein